MGVAVAAIGVLTAVSGLIVAVQMPETVPNV
jgi:hypothetical protein